MLWGTRRVVPPAVLLLAMGLLVHGSQALARDEGRAGYKRTWYGGIRLGAIEVEGIDEAAPSLGFLMGRRLLRHFDLTGAVDYHTAEFSFQDRSMYAFTAGLEFRPFKRDVGFQPYGLAGAGFYYSKFELIDELGDVYVEDFATEGGYHYGAGIDIPCCGARSDAGRINLEARRIFTEDVGDEEIEPDGFLLTLGYRLIQR